MPKLLQFIRKYSTEKQHLICESQYTLTYNLDIMKFLTLHPTKTVRRDDFIADLDAVGYEGKLPPLST
jgi:hypothetical protein